MIKNCRILSYHKKRHRRISFCEVFFLDNNFKKTAARISSLGLQTELLLPHIELCSVKMAKVEGCIGIIEYSEDTVKLNCGELIVSFFGSGLTLEGLCGQTVTVSGEMIRVEFSN